MAEARGKAKVREIISSSSSGDSRYWSGVCRLLNEDELKFITCGEWVSALGFRKDVGVKEALDELKKSARQQQTELRLQGKYVRGVLQGAPVKLSNSVVNILQDLNTGHRVALQICLCLSSKASLKDAASWLLPGTVIALKEPLAAVLTESNGDAYPLLVSASPAEMKFTDFVSNEKELSTRSLGNKLFQSGHLEQASLVYSQGASSTTERVLLLSNQAQACLKLGRVDEAILSASQALELDKLHFKSLYRKAQGLLAMAEYSQALECLKLAASLSDSPEVHGVKKLCELLYHQSVTGASYDLNDFLCGGLKPKLAPTLADFVGPVEIKSGKFGRGLYVSEDVKKGQLLLVSNAIAALLEPNAPQEDLVVELVKACRGSSKSRAQLEALAFTRNNDREVPDMKLFKPNVAWEPRSSGDEEAPVDVWRVSSVICLDSFSRSVLSNGVEFSSWSGVWGLPALMNHSCLPTVTRTEVGQAMLVRAARDLSAGEELVWSYIYSAKPLLSRTTQCEDSWGFCCSCERCEVEKKHGKLLRSVKASRGRELVRRLEEALQQLPEKEKRMIRAGYLPEYLSCSGQELEGIKGCPSWVELMKTAHEVMPGCEGNMELLTSFRIKVELEEAPAMNGVADKLVEEEVRGLYGELNGRAFDAFVEAWIRHRDTMLLQGHL